jgi:hypothetical protein
LDRQERDALAYLLEENRVLRAQLGGRRLRLTDDDRRRLAARAFRLGRQALRQVATIVTPDRLLRWHRCLDRTLFWTTADLEMKLLDFQPATTVTADMPGWRDARQTRAPPGPRTCECQFVSLAGALSWAVSNTDSGVTDGWRLGMPFESRTMVRRSPASRCAVCE